MQRFWLQTLLDKGIEVTAVLDFLPSCNLAETEQLLKSRRKQCPYKSTAALLTGLFPKKLCDVLMENKPEIPALAARIKEFPIKIKKTKPFKNAQVCTGGVSLTGNPSAHSGEPESAGTRIWPENCWTQTVSAAAIIFSGHGPPAPLQERRQPNAEYLQIKLPVTHTQEELEKKILSVLRISREELLSWNIARQSLDARKKPELFFVYTVEVSVKKEAKVLKKVRSKNVSLLTPKKFTYLRIKEETNSRPVIVGSGPSGLFCAYYLVKAGLKPLVLERGEDADNRLRTVEDFWKTGRLIRNPMCSSERAGQELFPTES